MINNIQTNKIYHYQRERERERESGCMSAYTEVTVNANAFFVF